MANKTIYTVAAGFMLAILCAAAVYIYGIYEYRTGYKSGKADTVSKQNQDHINAIAKVNAENQKRANAYLAKQKELEREKQKLESSLSGMRTIANSLQQQLNAASATSVPCDASAACERYRSEAEAYRLLFGESARRYVELGEEATADLILLHEAKDWILVLP
ncbi:hypothetical protein AB8Q18_08255 [Neisseriaceae bacterium CLB008]